MATFTLDATEPPVQMLNSTETILASTIPADNVVLEHFALNSPCNPPSAKFTGSLFGSPLAFPVWEAILTAAVLSTIIVITIIGNILVILSVFTFKPLHIVQNFYIVSLACADLTVALFVLPFNVAYLIFGRWLFGIYLCKIWLTCDVMCCTSSILNLCAIALDRYWAITDPVNNAHKRTTRRVLAIISGVWLLSFLISSPPLVGWNDWPPDFTSTTPCQLTSEPGYVIYSSLGSFYIPLLVMTIVYIKIYIATRKRLRGRERTLVSDTLVTARPLDLKRSKLTKFCCACFHMFRCRKSFDQATNSQVQYNQRQADYLSEPEPCTAWKRQTENEANFVLAEELVDTYELRACPSQRICYQIDSKIETKIEEHIESVVPIEVSTKIVAQKSATQGNTGLERQPTDVYRFIEERQKIFLAKERRAARTLAIIMGAFVICWLPFFLMYVILPFCLSCCPTSKLKNFITWLGYINSGLNPVIYTIFNLDYRKAFKRLLGLN